MMENLQLEEPPHAPKICQSMVVIFAAIVASVGGILFGYDIGITSGALLQLKDDFHLTSFEQEMVVSAVLVGAFCASFFGGNIVDSWGRKVGISSSCLLFIVGALTLSFSINFIMLIVGRFIVGVAVSLSVTSECTYISEISPPSHRGMMVSLNEVGITIGFLLAYLINYIFIDTYQGWKYMFGVAAVLALVQVIGVAFMPKSHHYLIIKGETDKARKVLCNLRNNNNVDEEIESINSSIEEQKSRRYLDLFSTHSNMRARMLLGMALVFLQQSVQSKVLPEGPSGSTFVHGLPPITASCRQDVRFVFIGPLERTSIIPAVIGNANVLYYAPTVFKHFGYDSNTSATLVTIGLGVVKVLSTIITLLIVDKVGRKSLLISGCLLMATSIMVLGIVGTLTNIHIRTDPNSSFISYYHHPISIESNITDNSTGVIWEIHHLQEDSYHGKEILEETTEETSFVPNIQSFNLTEYSSLNFEENITESSSLDAELQSVDHTNNMKRLHQLKENKNFTNVTVEGLINGTNDVPEAGNNHQVSLSVKITSVIALMVFVCAYGMSYGPVTWLMLSEIFPGCLRGRAFSVATCINWGANIIISLTFLDVLNAIGIGPTFITYGFISYGAAVFIFLCVPETKSKTLEEINELLSKGLLRSNMKMCTFGTYHEKYTIERISSDMNPDAGTQEKSYKQVDGNNSSFN